MLKDFFSDHIIEWYDHHQRDLPWRRTRDPYRIWLSEIILQQTRVVQGLPYYNAFVKTFPSVFDLARAPQQRVLRLWQGLGYYSRARNLHQCAKEVVKNNKGVFPDTFEGLKKLKGVGPYTAAAIASFAFRENVPVVDGNVFRVLSRVFGIDKDISSEEGKKYFFSLATELIDNKRPDVFNQAVMEFGALHCLPKNPKCDECIFSKKCKASLLNLQELLPVKSKKLNTRTRYLNYFVIRTREKTLMRQRNGRDIWQGLYDFYLIETPKSKKAESMIQQDKFLSESHIIKTSRIFTHLLSHQKLKVKFIEVEQPASKKSERVAKKLGLKAFTKKEISKLPKPILIDRFLHPHS
ncbi:MAG TPA: A/G-specific adenine glycosylase [Cyclobacteriaceae bacterium]|nr:A/G-specific adenine glycosylase [Cyclobacteriaceae bacterium]